jgi:hypothetical protein
MVAFCNIFFYLIISKVQIVPLYFTLFPRLPGPSSCVLRRPFPRNSVSIQRTKGSPKAVEQFAN